MKSPSVRTDETIVALDDILWEQLDPSQVEQIQDLLLSNYIDVENEARKYYTSNYYREKVKKIDDGK